MKQIILTDKAPAPIGPYSQGVAAGGQLVFFSGQIALTPAGTLVEGDIKAQTKQVLSNIDALLEAAGCSVESVVKTTCFLKSMNDFSSFNEVYGEYFGKSKPARSTVEVARLPKDVLVEVEVIASR